MAHAGPSCLLLSRQSVPHYDRTAQQVARIGAGAYVLVDHASAQGLSLPHAILIATGAEVALAVQAAAVLSDDGILVRVVSMPSAEVFLKQPETYQAQVLPSVVTARVAIEAAASAYWYQFVGMQGAVIGLDRFGASAPGEDVFQVLGLTVAQVVAKTKAVLAGGQISVAAAGGN